MNISDPTVLLTTLTVLTLGFLGLIFGRPKKLARNQNSNHGTDEGSHHNGAVIFAVILFVSAAVIFVLRFVL